MSCYTTNSNRPNKTSNSICLNELESSPDIDLEELAADTNNNCNDRKTGRKRKRATDDNNGNDQNDSDDNVEYKEKFSYYVIII